MLHDQRLLEATLIGPPLSDLRQTCTATSSWPLQNCLRVSTSVGPTDAPKGATYGPLVVCSHRAYNVATYCIVGLARVGKGWIWKAHAWSLRPATGGLWQI